MMNKAEELESRLIKFAITGLNITKSLKKDNVNLYLSDQVTRSMISPALNYAEARDAESRKDFIHKMKIVLKELRETNVALKIISNYNLYIEKKQINAMLEENNELISIFVKSITTAKKRIT